MLVVFHIALGRAMPIVMPAYIPKTMAVFVLVVMSEAMPLGLALVFPVAITVAVPVDMSTIYACRHAEM